MTFDNMSMVEIIAEAARRADRRARGLPVVERGPEDDIGAAIHVRSPRSDVPASRVWRYSGPQTVPSSGLRESAEQARCVKLLRLAGAEPPRGQVYSLSQSRATKQTEGLGDLFAVFASAGLSLWLETKVEGGAIRAAQSEFAAHCAAILQPHIFGDVRALVDWLVDHGLAAYDADEPHGVRFSPR